MDYTQIGKNIRHYRKLHMLTQQELAAKLTCSFKHLGNIERGCARPSLECLYEIAQTLQVSLDSLVSNPNETSFYTVSNIAFLPLMNQYLETQQQELQQFRNQIHTLLMEQKSNHSTDEK